MASGDELAVRRILDASGNRAAEGLRTVEEYARFVLEDPYLSEESKTLRHELRITLQTIGPNELLTARAVASDCGTTITTNSEHLRANPLVVVHAASNRIQEALRCIEEFSKTIPGFDASSIESLRYRAYTLAATVCLLPGRRERLGDAKLYLLIDASHDEDTFASRIAELYLAGVDVIQLRDKAADDRTLYRRAKIAADIARRTRKCFIVNDRADIAAAVHADGVHLGQEELPVEAARRVLGSVAIIGVSTHSIEQVKSAVIEGADYIGCGPTFPSRTKAFETFPGLAFLRDVAATTTLPSYAIGGVDESNLSDVIATGIHGVALASAILGASEPLAAAGRMREVLNAGYGMPCR